jgi:hypothetical protein
MSAFGALSGMLNAAVLATFGIPVTFTPQDGSGAQQITGIIQAPAMGEDSLPGSHLGAAVVRMFVQFTAIMPPPRHGDAITINGVVYAVADLDVDTQGGAVLKLRVS